MRKFIFIISFAIIFPISSSDIINIDDIDIKWNLYDVYKDGMKIHQSDKYFDEVIFTKISNNVNFSRDDIFSIILDVPKYNDVISNKNLSTHLVYTDNDTIYAYQKITNAIPFIRDRQYIFKMYKTENMITWTIVDKNHPLIQPYLSKDIKTLTLGAGSWLYKKDKVLINKIYVDDEVNMPYKLIRGIKINSVVNIFNDIMKYINKEKNK